MSPDPPPSADRGVVATLVDTNAVSCFNFPRPRKTERRARHLPRGVLTHTFSPCPPVPLRRTRDVYPRVTDIIMDPMRDAFERCVAGRRTFVRRYAPGTFDSRRFSWNRDSDTLPAALSASPHGRPTRNHAKRERRRFVER